MATKKVKLTEEEILESVDLSKEEYKMYSFEEMATILKEANVKPNSYKNVKVVAELQPLNWLYGFTGFSKSTKIAIVLVKGIATECGSEYLEGILEYPIRVKTLEEPIPMNELSAVWR